MVIAAVLSTITARRFSPTRSVSCWRATCRRSTRTRPSSSMSNRPVFSLPIRCSRRTAPRPTTGKPGIPTSSAASTICTRSPALRNPVITSSLRPSAAAMTTASFRRSPSSTCSTATPASRSPTSPSNWLRPGARRRCLRAAPTRRNTASPTRSKSVSRRCGPPAKKLAAMPSLTSSPSTAFVLSLTTAHGGWCELHPTSPSSSSWSKARCRKLACARCSPRSMRRSAMAIHPSAPTTRRSEGNGKLHLLAIYADYRFAPHHRYTGLRFRPGVCGMTVRTFGLLPDGTEVHSVTIADSELTAEILTVGAIIRDVRLAGVGHPLVLGYDRAEHYANNTPHIGAVAGRSANRIGHGRFSIDGRDYQVSLNEGGRHHLHGGFSGFAMKVWRLAGHDATSVTLELSSPDGDEGYPGKVDVTLRYSIEAPGTIRMDAWAVTDAPTLVNLAQHSYFNLDDSSDILDHHLQIFAASYTPTDSELVPTGE